MPKEVVLGKPINGVDSPQHVRVGWGNGDVQVGVEPHGGRSIFWHLLNPTELAVEMVEVLHGYEGKPLAIQRMGEDILNTLDTLTDQYDGLHVDMDREDINRLIKLLRKARDAAYGRDE